MCQKEEQVYLGDLISADGRQDKNIDRRKKKGIGIVIQIIDILKTTYFGKYYFEAALILRSSLLLSSILLNSEAWINLSNKNIRALEQIDEMLLSKILGCQSKTSNTLKYLELGIQPIRFEIMKRKLLFLHYILKQDKKSMLYKVLKTTEENSIKNDFVSSCKDDLKRLGLELTFADIENISKQKFKNLLKNKVKLLAFEYLMEQKENQSKAKDIKYKRLEIQRYFVEGNCSASLAKLIFKARTRTLDIKTQKSWKYTDKVCVGCEIREETGDEIMSCLKLHGENSSEIKYSWFYSGCALKMVKAGVLLKKGLEEREKLLIPG